MTKSIVKNFSPQLATLTHVVPGGNEWIHEEKFDGYRILAYIKQDSVYLITRNGKNWSSKFPTIVDSLKHFPKKNSILDGELVVLDKKGLSKFQLLQNALERDNQYQVTFFVFDMPVFDGANICQTFLKDRKLKLKVSFKEWKNCPSNIILTTFITGFGQKVYKEACRHGLEGIISKNILSHYEHKRTKTWLKSKCIHRQEFVIGGYTKPRRSRKYFGALLLGYYNKHNSLIYCGKVGTGFSEKTLSDLYKKMSSIIQNKSPFYNSEDIEGKVHITWIKPKLAAELTFTEWTADGKLRHPSFIGLRQDKKIKEIKKE